MRARRASGDGRNFLRCNGLAKLTSGLGRPQDAKIAHLGFHADAAVPRIEFGLDRHIKPHACGEVRSAFASAPPYRPHQVACAGVFLPQTQRQVLAVGTHLLGRFSQRHIAHQQRGSAIAPAKRRELLQPVHRAIVQFRKHRLAVDGKAWRELIDGDVRVGMPDQRIGERCEVVR